MYASGATNDAGVVTFPRHGEKHEAPYVSPARKRERLERMWGSMYPDAPVVIVGKPQGGPGNGFYPPGQAKKGSC